MSLKTLATLVAPIILFAAAAYAFGKPMSQINDSFGKVLAGHAEQLAQIDDNR